MFVCIGQTASTSEQQAKCLRMRIRSPCPDIGTGCSSAGRRRVPIGGDRRHRAWWAVSPSAGGGRAAPPPPWHRRRPELAAAQHRRRRNRSAARRSRKSGPSPPRTHCARDWRRALPSQRRTRGCRSCRSAARRARVRRESGSAGRRMSRDSAAAGTHHISVTGETATGRY